MSGQPNKKFIYAPEVNATENNLKEAEQAFERVLQNAPKANELKDRSVTVAPKFNLTGKKINLSDLLKDMGHFSKKDQKTSDAKTLDDPTAKVEFKLK